MPNSPHTDVVYAQGHAHEPASQTAARAGEVTRGDAPVSRKHSFLSTIKAYPATSTLMAINLLVFLVMFRWSPVIPLLKAHQYGQVFTAEFDVSTLWRFGGFNNSMIVTGQWWRLIAACFVHASILHIGVNLWCLWNLGLFGEPLLGKWGLTWVYLLTGVTGNLLSVAWALFTRTDATVVGASGAIFGIAGILIVLLSNRRLPIPWPELKHLRAQVILFAVINLALGVAPNFAGSVPAGDWARLHVNPNSLPHIANGAHVGGCVSGLLLGLPLFPKMMTGRASYRARQRVTFWVAGLLLALVTYALTK